MWKRQIGRAYPGEPGLVMFYTPNRLTRGQRKEIRRAVKTLRRYLNGTLDSVSQD